MKRRGRRSGGKKTGREKALQRRSLHQPDRGRFVIVCEGRETEPNCFWGLYFWGLQKAVQQNFSVVVKKGKGGSVAVVDMAIDELEMAAARGENFDEVWCVFDVEQAGQRKQ